MSTERIGAIAGQDVKVTGVRFFPGEYGELGFFDVVTPDSKKHTIMTGDAGVIETLKEAVLQKALPCEAKFTQRGRSWIIE